MFFPAGYTCAQKQTIDDTLHYLRNADPREWSGFPEHAENELMVHFTSLPNTSEQTLSLRQYDIKQDWQVRVNDHDLGLLVIDEKDITTYLPIPDGVLRAGENTIQIKSKATIPDDIRVGEIMVHNRPPGVVLSESGIDITIIENGKNVQLPARITILNERRSLQTVTAMPDDMLAIRPGYVYTGNGKASLRLPAGKYTVFAGRGFEYSIDSIQVELKPGDHIEKTLAIKREVETNGWISSDTHVHTFTHSGHGDATIEERAITLAGEDIDLPVMTDHNIYVDLIPTAKASGMLKWFTPVTGDELTTKVGHFNVFKTTVGTNVISHQAENWNDISKNINDAENNKVIILNHARDIHNGFRPFDPSRHLSSAGTGKDDWKFPANAMEVINSGSQQTDYMQLHFDWFGMLNRGYFLTPVGCSDSHDVSRFTVGQGRTYIQAGDTDANINVVQAIKNFREGKVMVSAGLLTKLTVNKNYGPGDLVPAKGTVNVAVEVSGPAWTHAEKVTLYANGKKIREEKNLQKANGPLTWKMSWDITLPKHDIFLVAIAEGPGEGMPWWPISKPYQPASADWTPKIIGSTGAVWIDADKNRKRNSAYDYAKGVVDSSKDDMTKMISSLALYDEAVAIQVAALLWKNGRDLASPEILAALNDATPETKAGFSRIAKEIEAISR